MSCLICTFVVHLGIACSNSYWLLSKKVSFCICKCSLDVRADEVGDV
jgi:hypothetical protein